MATRNSPTKRHPLRALLALAMGLVVAALVLLVIEGCVSLWTGGSLLRRPFTPTAVLVDGWTDAQRARLADLTPGPFTLDRDPYVGHNIKASSVRTWVDSEASTDAFGMRKRPGGWPEADRPRWVVLGDSVAFGMGVQDDQTYAARLEAQLAKVWPADQPQPAVLTVGVPGWSVEAAIRYLRNHLHRYRPSLVLLMPVDNDLENRFVPTAAGGRHQGIDPTTGVAGIHVTTESFYDLYGALASRAPLSRITAVASDGGLPALEFVLTAGLAPESQRRYRSAVDAALGLRRQLAKQGSELFVVFGWAQPFHRRFDARLQAAEEQLPRGFLFDGWRPEDALEGDSHPNAACVDAGAIGIIGLLHAQGLLPPGCDIGSLVLPPGYAQRVAKPFDAAAADAWASAQRDLLERHCGPRVSFVDAAGFQQIYGGVEPDGTVGLQARLALRGQGNERALRMRLLPPASGNLVAALRIGCAFADDPGRPTAMRFGSLRRLIQLT